MTSKKKSKQRQPEVSQKRLESLVAEIFDVLFRDIDESVTPMMKMLGEHADYFTEGKKLGPEDIKSIKDIVLHRLGGSERDAFQIAQTWRESIRH